MFSRFLINVSVQWDTGKREGQQAMAQWERWHNQRVANSGYERLKGSGDARGVLPMGSCQQVMEPVSDNKRNES